MSWKSIIANLSAKDLSQAQIATLCKCGQATISDLAKGSTLDPRFSLGETLIALSKESKEQLALRLGGLEQASVAPTAEAVEAAKPDEAGDTAKPWSGPERRGGRPQPPLFPDLDRREPDAARLAGHTA